MNYQNKITEITRRDITDYIIKEKIQWWGRIKETEFLKRIWPEVFSGPGAPDVERHRYNFHDWEDDWIFTSSEFNFNFYSGPNNTFLKFLCLVLSPEVRSDEEPVGKWLSAFNMRLNRDGWTLIEADHAISGRATFEYQKLLMPRSPVQLIKFDKYSSLKNQEALSKSILRMERDVGKNPPAAIGEAKELLESVYKTILDDYSIDYAKDAKMHVLYQEVQKALDLDANAVKGNKQGSMAIGRSLKGLNQAITSIPEMRNAIGSGHGQSSQSPALPIHAQLAVTSTIAIVEFLLSVWRLRKEEAMLIKHEVNDIEE